MDTTELLKQVRKIEIKTKGLTKQIFSGDYQSAFKGRGMSFSEVREYQYGDDVRNIDWNVTARTGNPHIKVFEEERELTVMLLIDLSGSAFFGSQQKFKSALQTEIGAVLAFSASTNNDKVGAIFFSDRIEGFIPPKKGRSHILRIIREMIDLKPEGKGTDINLALDYMNRVIKKRAISFVISDFMNTGYEDSFRIAARRHDIIALRLQDPRDQELPAVGMIRAKDAETGQMIWVDTDSRAVRDGYREQYHKFDNYLQNTIKRCSADLVNISSEEGYIHALIRFFQKRSS